MNKNNWKTATAVPIPKVNDAKKCEGFRSINIVPSMENIIEFRLSKNNGEIHGKKIKF